MTEIVRRIFVEKKPGFDVEAGELYHDLKENLGIQGLEGVRILHRYDMSGLSDTEYQQARATIFAEPPVDVMYDESFPVQDGETVFATEYLPGQYDQRADSAAQCIQILTQKERPLVMAARVIVLRGSLAADQVREIKAYCINPVESRAAGLEKPAKLQSESEIPADVMTLTGLQHLDASGLAELHGRLGLAMNLEDLEFCQGYFRDTEHRDPTITELRVIDTYWSDHCRHTTFLTQIQAVDVEAGRFSSPVAATYTAYLQARSFVYGNREKDICLMDIATMGMRELRKRGLLNDLDESEEVNACSIVVDVEVDGATEPWLVMFKNETHNHPTEIEPFGGAATCLGGAIRDPLSGRSYVYQAMRVSGSGDPRRTVEETLPGKLPQRKITIGAAAGYSSYGNQIGLATGQVAEIYDEGFVAKRMEIGAVIAAAPRDQVVREAPAAGDVVLLVGGRTGRDGCGGATGSSKEHTEESLATCGAEVQKGNPPTERKIQRLFRRPAVSRMIKRCNDFGAGGVSVSIGELTDGIRVNLDAVPKKYEGLDGTELAISESQERMAVVVAAVDAAEFQRQAEEENVEATLVAEVTDEGRLVMEWRGKKIVDISREFLNTNGVKQKTQVRVVAPEAHSVLNDLPLGVVQVANESKSRSHIATDLGNLSGSAPQGLDMVKAWVAVLEDLNVCAQKGLVERFDSTIGAGTVLMPFGGTHQLTPLDGMAAKIPVLKGDTDTATVMTYGYDPAVAKWSPFHGAVYAVVDAVAKTVAMGGDAKGIRLTLQEYFEKLGQDPVRWGKPFSALLGAFYAQQQLEIPAIGGKDSMSGTFKDLHVPPTLVAFAVSIAKASQLISPEFKRKGSRVYLVTIPRDEYDLPDFETMRRVYGKVQAAIREGKILAAQSVRYGGVAAAVSKMCFGNGIGLEVEAKWPAGKWFLPEFGALVLEAAADADLERTLCGYPIERIGRTSDKEEIAAEDWSIPLEVALRAWKAPLEKIFPTQAEEIVDQPLRVTLHGERNTVRPIQVVRPRVLIPVFPGTNCEYDTARAFEKAGAEADVLVIRNLSSQAVEESIQALSAAINRAQIVALPGGFSAGDEPDGSGKFIAAMFRNPRVKDAVMDLLKQRDGLMLGICNGFQALIKLGLVPYGEIVDQTVDSPTLTFNRIGRHVSCMVQTKVTSVLSPWFSRVQKGDIHTVAVSHGEGRFVADAAWLERLAAQGQIATQYVDDLGRPSYDIRWNPNGSMLAVEGITSPDGRVLGKMGHSERWGQNVCKNVPGNKDQEIFVAGVDYFR